MEEGGGRDGVRWDDEDGGANREEEAEGALGRWEEDEVGIPCLLGEEEEGGGGGGGAVSGGAPALGTPEPCPTLSM